MKMAPPKRALKFLRWFCRKDYLEEIEGDLLELFEKQYEDSPVKAKRKFTWSVIKYLRTDFIKSFKNVNNSNSIAMFKNHVKIAWRSLKRQPFFTSLNIFGLAIGMAGSLLVGLYIHDELSFDKMFADSERIYRINIDNRTAGEESHHAAVSGALASVIREDYPHQELVTRFKNEKSALIRKVGTVQNVKENNVVGVDQTFFEMFGLDLLIGDKSTALNEANTLILTRTAAEKHFGINEAVGQSMLLNNKDVFIVTGVIEDLPKNSFLRNHGVFMSISSFEDADNIAWNNWNYPTFVKLLPTAKKADLDAYASTVTEHYLIPWAMSCMPGLTVESAREMNKTTGNYLNFVTINLTDIHLYSADRDGEFSRNGAIQNVYILSFVGFFLILLASINFMNLSTAYSLKRAKEVGIRKTLGSNRLGLIKQFLTEAGLMSFISLLCAIVVASLALPYFNALSGKSIVIPYTSFNFWLIMLITALILGLFSGSYPAFLMSKFSPIRGLKGNSDGNGNGKVRNFLVIFQFAISVFLIVSTLVVFE